MTEREALKLALEALKHTHPSPLTSFYTIGDRDKAIKAIEEHLAQPEQEPVAYTTGHCENHKQKGGCQLHNLQCGWPDCDRKPITTPPQRTWVGLTNDERVAAVYQSITPMFVALSIEAKLKEKNT